MLNRLVSVIVKKITGYLLPVMISFQFAGAYQIEKGVIDFRRSGINLSNVFEIHGEWELYYHATFADISRNNITPEYLRVPGVWNNLGHPGHGYGVYRFRAIIDHLQDTLVALRTYSISSSYNFYVNGKLYGKVGIFDTIEEKNIPDYHPQYFVFRPVSDTLDLAFEIANFNYKKGGIWYDIYMGNPWSILRQRDQNMFLTMGLIGALLIMFFYHICLYYLNRSEKALMYFGFLCLFSAIRISTTGEILIRQLDWPVSWEWLIRFEFISFFMMLGFGGMYMRYFYPDDTNKKLSLGMYYVNILISVLVLFTPARISSYIIQPYLYFGVIQLLYYFIVLLTAVVRKRSHSWIMLIGYMIIFITGINDILYSQEIIQTSFLVPYGVFTYVIIQGVAIGSKYSAAFKTIADLSGNLKEANITLIQKVDERTSELSKQKQDLESLNSLKDKLFSIIAHDIRGPMITLQGLFDLLDENRLGFDETKLFIANIRKNVENLGQTLDNLLHWSRSQMDGIIAVSELIDVRKSVDEAVELYHQPAKDKGIEIDNKVTQVEVINIDPNHFSLIMRNLISNAVKFTRIGGKIIIEKGVHENGYFVLVISDNGIGMNKEKIDSIMNGNGHESTYGTSNEKGTGIGLMICKEFVEKNGGQIKIESKLNEGTKVKIWFRKD